MIHDQLYDIQKQYRDASQGQVQLAHSNYYTVSEKLIMFEKIIENLKLLLKDAEMYRDGFKSRK